MQRQLLSIALVSSCLMLQAQDQIQLTATPFAYEMGNARGTDTLFTIGMETTPFLYSYQIGDGGGNLMGPNALAMEEFAQEFELYGDAVNVDGIVFLFGNLVYGGNAASHIKARLYALNGTGGQTTGGPAARPNTVLAEVQLPLADVENEGISGVSFAPVWIAGNFAAGYSLNGLASGDSLNLFASEVGYVEVDDKSWFRAGPVWATYKFLGASQATPVDINVDLAVGAVLTPSSVGVGSNSWMNGMQIDILGGNPNRDGFIVRYAVQDAADMRLFIIDAMGRTMMDQQLGRRTGENQQVVNTNGWAAGTYFVNMIANGKPITKRVVVE